MKAWRTPFYLLLAINLVLALFSGMSLFGQRLPWTENGERERLARQLTPDQIRVGEPVAAQSAQAASAPPVASADCALIRNLTQEDSQQLEGMARDYAARLGVSIRSRSSGIVPTSYWVHIPPAGGRHLSTACAAICTFIFVMSIVGKQTELTELIEQESRYDKHGSPICLAEINSRFKGQRP